MKKVLTSLAILSFMVMAFALPTKTQAASKKENTAKTETAFALQKYYKADDGSYIYMRQIKNKVYAFAEHLNGSAASVIVGSITGSTINADYYYVPKGEAKGKGKISFRVESGGSTLTLVTGSNGAYNIKKMTAMRLPSRVPAIRRAWYRGNTPDNLTGRWMAENVGESHILETDDQIIMYTSGYRKGNNLRPQFSTVFIGTRSGNTIKGDYVDLPLGYTDSHGEAGFNVEGTHILRVNHHYYPGVKHKRNLTDSREVLTKTVKRSTRTKVLKPVGTKGENHQ